jgi:hypothetical protein
LLSYYGAKHPTRFKIIRQFIATCQLSGFDKNISQAAWKARLTLRDGFREWLGSKQQVAVDPETEEEYTWHDVIIFEEDIDSAAKDRLSRALQNTILVREAVFLFSRGILVRLNDIPPGGVWVSFLGSEHGKSVFRLTIQTRYQGSFDVAVNVNYKLTYEEIVKEINWLIRAGTTAGAKKLVEDFGGYWKEYNLWTEEFIPGETTGKFLLRISRQMDEIMRERLCILWPYFIWSGVMDYVDFWHRTGRNMELLDPSPDNIIIPLHDYQTGSRIVSMSARRKHRGPLNLMTNLYKSFVKDVEAEYPFLHGIGDYKYIFSAFLEVMGQNEGLKLLHTCLRLLNKKPSMEGARELIQELTHYIESVKKSGFIPQRLYFAIKRYQRWVTLNKDATYRAKAATLSELYDTYELHLLEPAYPETRMRYFSNTVFKQSDPVFRLELEKIINLHKTHNLSTEDSRLKISALQKLANLSEEDLYFILRMTYPHLSPTDSADLISLETGGTVHSDIVIQMVDNEGNIYGIRSPITPKEIARLQQLYITNQLPVQFKPEHRYLIAVNERGQLIGGIFFKAIEKDTIHLDKIVVERYYRKKGVSDGLLNEFFKRMKVENYRYITTGFFRPEYFYRFGFKIERKYAGLVKNLEEESPQKLPV